MDTRAYRRGLQHPIACRGFRVDMKSLRDCDACVLVQPCGRSAHLEAGIVIGAGKPVIVYVLERMEPELMLAAASAIVTGDKELLSVLRRMLERPRA